jgi:AraC family transcriptional regulator
VTHPSEPIIHHEHIWFSLLNDSNGNEPSRGVSVSRWQGFAGEAREEVSEIKPDCHVLGVTLRPMDVTAFAAHKLIHDGRAQQGMMRVNEPGLPLRAIFRGAYDTLHLHIKNVLIEECIEAGCRQSRSSVRPSWASQPSMDPVIERLANALIRADDFGGTFGQCYADGVGLAIVARLLARSADVPVPAGVSRVSRLPKWRLKRATDYIAAHLGEPIGLADIAAATGLTRMHFAAQFRASTGLRPHDYLVRRRIERAQELLAASDLPLAEIALEVGFKAQAHFTTVFSRVVGETPSAWRRQNSMSGASGRMAGHRCGGVNLDNAFSLPTARSPAGLYQD